MKKQILVGSTYFFKSFDDFESKDKDYVVLIENPTAFKNVRQTSYGARCLFEWRKMSANEFMEYTLNHCVPMELGKFLVPEFAQAIGLTITDLKRLAPLTTQLDKKHEYEKIIFDAYIKNGKFELTAEQLANARSSYENARKK